MGNQLCCDDTKGAELGQNPPIQITRQNPDSMISKGSSIIAGPGNSIPDVSDQVRDHLDANKPFFDKLPSNPTVKRFGQDVYEGKLDSSGRPEGFGKMYKGSGDLYIGSFQKGKADGPGRYIFKNGSYYEGEFKENEAETTKGYYYSDDLEYRGGFKNNTFHGHGSEKGRKHEYEGTYNNGKRTEGVFKWDTVPNNDVYEYIFEGKFDDEGKFHGKGKLQQIKGIYEGQFNHGDKHGKGTYKYNSKIKYVGEYVKGLKEGEGTIYNEDNSIAYSGGWKNGLPNGKGYVIDEQGNQIESIWKDGVDSKLLEQ